jgi:Holliday junction DNA helicase RuvA
MIALLRGQLLEKHPNRLIVDVQGVGYDVQVPVSTFYQAGEPGQNVTLRIHTHVREDQLALFGFASMLEQQLFERLISVNGIGPKLALAVLSGIEPKELVAAVPQTDVARLTRIPGVGRKTAERITLELRDRLPAIAELPTAGGAIVEESHGSVRDDVISALVNLGYQRPAVEKAVERVLKASDAPDGFEETLRQALRHLSR